MNIALTAAHGKPDPLHATPLMLFHRTAELRSYALICFAFSLSAANAQSDELETLLARTREATGSEKLAAHRNGVLLRGAGEFLGVPSEWSLYLAGDGRLIERVEGRLPRVQARDARGWWTVDWARALREPIGRERMGNELDFAFLGGSLWAETCIYERELGRDSTADEVQITLRGAELLRPVALWISRATALPARLEVADPEGATITRAVGWKPLLDFQFPSAVRFESVSGDSHYRVTEADDAPAFFVDPIQRPTGPPLGTQFDPDLPPEIEIRRAPTKHLLTRARLHDGVERWFLLDSGAGALVIDKQTADALELEAFGAIKASGVGGHAPARFRSAKSFQLGPLVMADPILLELDLSPIAPFFGVELAGIVGYDVFARAIVELDLKAASARIHDPASFRTPNGMRWEELKLDSRIPTLTCRFEGDREGLFRMDTGDSGTVTFHTPTVDRLQLLMGRKTRRSPLGGVGGFIEAELGKLEWFEVGGRRNADLEVHFAAAKSGPFSTPEIDGNLGTRLFEPFLLYFDYRSERLGFLERR